MRIRSLPALSGAMALTLITWAASCGSIKVIDDGGSAGDGPPGATDAGSGGGSGAAGHGAGGATGGAHGGNGAGGSVGAGGRGAGGAGSGGRAGGSDGGTCSAVPGCCGSDRDCTKTQECAGITCGSMGKASGVCKPRPTVAGQCWTDADCVAGGLCAGAITCPCGAACLRPDMIGTCSL